MEELEHVLTEPDDTPSSCPYPKNIPFIHADDELSTAKAFSPLLKCCPKWKTSWQCGKKKGYCVHRALSFFCDESKPSYCEDEHCTCCISE